MAIRNRLLALFIALACIQLVPIWAVRYLPTVDGPSHLYNSSILLRLLSGEEGRLTDFYQIDWRPNPNWTGHAVMAGLMTFLPPLIVEKLFVTAIIGIFLYGAWRFAAEPAYAFLAFPFVYHQSLQFGFYNFSLAIGLFLILLGAWGPPATSRPVRRLPAGGLLLLLLYFSHPLPLLVAMLSMGILWLFDRERRFADLIVFVPASALMIWYYTTQRAMSKPPELRHLIEFIVKGIYMLTFDFRQEIFGTAIFVLYVVLAIATLWLDRKRAFNAFGVILAILAVLYFVAPAAAAGGLGVNDRIGFFLFLVPLAWFSPRIPKRAQIALVALMTVAAIGNVAFLLMRYRRADHAITEIVRTFDGAAPGATFVPLLFDARPPRSVVPLLPHAADYAALDHRLIDLTNYEPEVGYFPIRYRPGIAPLNGAAIATAPQDFDVAGNAARVDAIFTWKMPPLSPLETRLNERYTLAREWANGRLYKLKR